MKTLAIDRGNSFVKWAVFESRDLIEKGRLENDFVGELKKVVEKYQIKEAIYSASGEDETLKNLALHSVAFDHQTPLPISLNYKTPETLGLDRVANAVAVYKMFPDSDSLAIDLGTCVTYDLVNSSGEYQGGAISPGLKMRYRAMNNFTARLPLVSEPTASRLTGKSTLESLQSGAFFGLKHEIEGFINAFLSDHSKLKVALTGGDMTYFEKELKSNIFADSDLTLKGLNEILLYNIN
ncbi:type III pantothenate kinase [Halocola ammonii]